MRTKLSIAAIVILFAGGAFWAQKYKSQKEAEHAHFLELVSQSTSTRDELVKQYEKRYELLLNWSKESGIKINPNLLTPFRSPLLTDADFLSFDQYQNEVTNELSKLASSETAQKSRPKELEKLEESINRTRVKYHETAFEQNRLIEHFHYEPKIAPIFPAEKLLHDAH